MLGLRSYIWLCWGLTIYTKCALSISVIVYHKTFIFFRTSVVDSSSDGGWSTASQFVFGWEGDHVVRLGHEFGPTRTRRSLRRYTHGQGQCSFTSTSSFSPTERFNSDSRLPTWRDHYSGERARKTRFYCNGRRSNHFVHCCWLQCKWRLCSVMMRSLIVRSSWVRFLRSLHCCNMQNYVCGQYIFVCIIAICSWVVYLKQ